MDNIECINLLRTKIPIGIKHASQLLIETNGDIELAVMYFKTRAIDIVSNKLSLSPQQALSLLEQYHFEINDALKAYEQQQYSLTERILKKHRHSQSSALDTLLIALIEHHQFKINYWFTEQQLASLNPYQYAFVLVLDWYNYVEWEDFYSALQHQHLPNVIIQIEQTFNYPEFANKLRTTTARQIELEQKHLKTKDIESYITFNNHILIVDAEMIDGYQYVKANSLALLERLYIFIEKNINHFP